MNNGGPAFPQIIEGRATTYNGGSQEVVKDVRGGMSLRDYFAAKAMQSLSVSDLDFGTVSQPKNPWPWVAEESYKAADSMIVQRTRTTKEGK